MLGEEQRGEGGDRTGFAAARRAASIGVPAFLPWTQTDAYSNGPTAMY